MQKELALELIFNTFTQTDFLWGLNNMAADLEKMVDTQRKMALTNQNTVHKPSRPHQTLP